MDGVWRTIKGRRVFIKNGETPTEAFKRQYINEEKISKNQKEQIEKSENEIYSLNIEYLYAIDENGNVSKFSSNLPNAVLKKDIDLSKVKNAICVHNHPSGSCFSPGDIFTFVDYDMKETRVICKQNDKIVEYSFKKDKNFDYTFTYPEFKKNFDKNKKNLIKEVNSGNMTVDYANKMLSESSEKWFNENSSKYNFIYKKEIKG